MFDFFMENLSTILVALVVFGCVLLAMRSIHRDKKNGKACSGCAGGCSGCAGSSGCHDHQE